MTYKVARSKIGLSLRSPTNFNKNIQRIETLTDTKIFIEIGYDKNSNRRYAKARMIGEDPTSDPFKRESWYDYTVGNRVILRDCILKDGKNITIAPGQGMKLDYRRDRITTQTTRNEAGNLEVKALGYDAAQLLRHINTRELFDDGRKGDRVLSDVERRIDHAQRCDQVHQFRHDHKEQKTTETVDETTQFDQNNNTRKQTRVEITGKFNGKPKDRERTDNLRTIDKASNTGRVLRETSKLTGTIKTKDKDGDDREIPFTITDAAKHGHVATGNGGIREGDVSVNRTIDCDDKNFQYDKRVPVEATQTTTQDANGHTASVRGPKHPGSENDSYRSFVTTPVDDCIVYKQTQAGRNYYIYAELKPGKMVLQAYFGDLVDRDDGALSAWKPKVVNLDTNHQALSAQYPPPMATEYTVPRRMTFRELAEELNYTGYASRIAEDNNKYEGDYIEAGERIIIRPLYFEIPETAWNGRMPSVDSIIGSLYPSLPSPHIWLKPEKHKVNWLATFLEVAAFSAIMAFLPGALVAGPNLLGAILSYGAAGLVGGTVDQMIAMGFGEQKGFDLRALATTTLTAAISGGVLQQNGLLKVAAKGAEAATKAATVAQTMAKVSIDRAIIVATEMAVAQHAFLLATGLERKFDWRTLGVSAFNAVVGHGINHTVGNQALNIGLNTALTSVAGSLIMHQKIDAAHLTASIAGQIVGNLAASPLVERNKRAAEEEARKEKAAPKATPKQKAAEVQKQAGKKQKPVNDRRAHAEDQRKTRAERWNAPRSNFTDLRKTMGSLQLDPDLIALANNEMAGRSPGAGPNRMNFFNQDPDVSAKDRFWEGIGTINGFGYSATEPFVNLPATIKGLGEFAENAALSLFNLDRYGKARSYFYDMTDGLKLGVENLRAQTKHPDPYTRGYAKGNLFSFAAPETKIGLIGQTRKIAGVPLYRAVGPEELKQISQTKVFQNPHGIENKYFSTTQAGAEQYAQMAEKAFGDPPYTIIKTTVPQSVFQSLSPEFKGVVDRGIPSALIPTPQLRALSPPEIISREFKLLNRSTR